MAPLAAAAPPTARGRELTLPARVPALRMRTLTVNGTPLAGAPWQLWRRPARQCCGLNGSRLWQFAGGRRARQQFRRICMAQFRKLRSDEGRHRLESPRHRILRDFYRSYALQLGRLPARLGGGAAGGTSRLGLGGLNGGRSGFNNFGLNGNRFGFGGSGFNNFGGNRFGFGGYGGFGFNNFGLGFNRFGFGCCGFGFGLGFGRPWGWGGWGFAGWGGWDPWLGLGLWGWPTYGYGGYDPWWDWNGFYDSPSIDYSAPPDQSAEPPYDQPPPDQPQSDQSPYGQADNVLPFYAAPPAGSSSSSTPADSTATSTAQIAQPRTNCFTSRRAMFTRSPTAGSPMASCITF